MKRALLLVVLLAPVPTAVAQEAQEKQLPNELVLANSVSLQDADELETAVSFEFLKLPDEKQTTVTTEFAYGLTSRWELDLDVPYEFVKSNHVHAVDGIGDIEADVRYGVVPVTNQPFAVTAGLGFGIPTGDSARDLGEGRLTLEPFVTASTTWFSLFDVELTCGWRRAVTNGGDEPRNDFEYNIAITRSIGDWYLTLEGNGESNRDRTLYYVAPGLIWNQSDTLQFALAIPIGVTHESADYGIVVSVTLEWEHVMHRSPDKD
jgi:Putative MetA-pathway of phenol degradation